MTMNHSILWAIGAALIAVIMVASAARAEGDAARGAELYDSRCTGCHSLDANRVGPMHRGVYGRKAGSVSNFSYSPAVKNSSVVWADDTLNKWLTNPQDVIPGQRMNFRVNTAEDRADIIAFLKKESGK
jgi:cytochrome c